MIVRAQFVEKVEGKKKIVHSWCLFSVNPHNDLKEIFDNIYDKDISCGRELKLENHTKDGVCASSLVTTEKCPSELMPTTLILSPAEIKEDNIGSLWVEYEIKRACFDTHETDASIEEVDDTITTSSVYEPPDTITNVLMNKFDHYVAPKSGKYGNVKQFNALIEFVKERKYGVQGPKLEDFRDFLSLFSSLLWELDPHYSKICSHGGGKLPKEIEKLLGFNDPMAQKHATGAIKIGSLKSKVSLLIIKLERRYMNQRHMKSFGDLVLRVCDAVSKYGLYLETQKARFLENQNEVDDVNEEDIEDYTIRKLQQGTGKSYFTHLAKVKKAVEECDVYTPININENISSMDRRVFFKLMKNVTETGFPLIDKNVSLYYFRLPSQGPHPAVHFIWKANHKDIHIENENAKMIVHLKSKQKSFYSRASKRIIKNTLYRIGIAKPFKAEYIMKNLMGDASAPVNETASAILTRFNRYVQLGEDIIQDLRENNGAVPKFDSFWDIVQKFIDDKTSVDDRRHCSSSGDDIVVNMAIATSLSSIFKQCKQIAANSDPSVDVPTYSWFLHQFWPASRTINSMTHYTGRFQVKRMVQARLMRKENIDSHYANAIYSFIKDRACEDIPNTVMVSADAKCKVSVGEPGYPIAAVSRGKQVVVGKNETYKVGDHDYSKLSLIPDAMLFQTIPERVDECNENEEPNKEAVGKWYTGKVFYSVKDMPLEGSTAIRGVTELSKALLTVYPDNATVPPRLYLYADGGGDRKNSNFKVQKSLIGLFLKHDLDELIAARPAANHSYRNAVERCHAIANLGLQSVGMMRCKQDDDFERMISKCNGNADIEKECVKSESFKASYVECIKRPRELLEEVLSQLSLKGEPFKILEPATKDEMDDLIESLSVLGRQVEYIDSSADIKMFYERHCVSRTYYFQISKCSDPECRYHKPIRGKNKPSPLSDPIPYEEDGVVHYRPGSDPEEKFLPSKLDNPEKRTHNVPFSPTAQTAKNVGIVVECEECKKPRLLHAQKKLQSADMLSLKRTLGKFSYVCGSVLSEYQGTGGENVREREIFKKVFVRENLSCISKIELPYFSVDSYKKVCVHCGVSGTARMLGNSVEHYPKCQKCGDKPEVLRRKRKSVVQSDLAKKKK